MAEVNFAFKTTAGNEFQKKTDSAGRTYYVQKGEGRINSNAFSGANQSLKRVLTEVDGQVPTAIAEAETAQELENVTQIPFTSDVLFTDVSAAEAESKAQALNAERNRFLGFWGRQTDDPDRDEAARRYLEFRNKVAETDDPEARAVIKSRYNIGGS